MHLRPHGRLARAATIAAALAGLTATGLGTASAAGVKPADSQETLYKFVNYNSGLCLDVHESGTADFTNVDQYQCNGTGAQEFYMKKVGTTSAGDDIVEIVNWNSRKCVEVYESQTQNGANVDQYTCNGTATQKWNVPQIDIDGRLLDIFYNANAHKAMEVYESSLANFGNVDVWSENGTATQDWYAEQVGTGICIPSC